MENCQYGYLPVVLQFVTNSKFRIRKSQVYESSIPVPKIWDVIQLASIHISGPDFEINEIIRSFVPTQTGCKDEREFIYVFIAVLSYHQRLRWSRGCVLAEAV
jgi:hypothetical protein